MAEDAHFHRQPRAAVPDQRIVAIVAGRGGNHRPDHLHRRAVRNEIEDIVGRLRKLGVSDELAQVALRRNTDRVRGGGIEIGRRLGGERVSVVSVGVRLPRAAGIGGGLNLRRIAVDARFQRPSSCRPRTASGLPEWYAAMKRTVIAPGVVTPYISSGRPFGSVSVTRAVIVPSLAMAAEAILTAMPGRMKLISILVRRLRPDLPVRTGFSGPIRGPLCDQRRHQHRQ